MIYELVEEAIELTLIVVSLYFALGVYLRRKQPTWSEPLAKRRLAILSVLVLAVTAIEVTGEVFGGESGPIDEALLLFVHSHVPPALTGFFQAVTLTGSSRVLIPLTIAATIAFVLRNHRFEALLVGASVASGATLVYIVKMTVVRSRPALWETEWYWGSSFPSGHTLVVAAFATAIALGVSRIWPAARGIAHSIALVWITLVGFSRVVLGVHWPTDVLAAACIGAVLPLAMSVVFELRRGLPTATF